MDHVFDSKWLINELSRLGFSISCDEVTRYKQSVLLTDEDTKATSAFTQWVADNVDHNISTLDGLGTFHGMGIISVTTGTGIIASSKKDKAIQRMTR